MWNIISSCGSADHIKREKVLLFTKIDLLYLILLDRKMGLFLHSDVEMGVISYVYYKT